MRKLSEYVEKAAAEYLRETGAVELDARWIAEFYQDEGVVDEHPLVDLVAFSALVQKALTVKAERAGKQAHRHIEKVRDRARRGRRTQ